MFARYQLQVYFDSHLVFDGTFTSINQAVKTAARFSDECYLRLYDFLIEDRFSDPMIYELVKEFRYAEVLS